jgi:hypothetical protein
LRKEVNGADVPVLPSLVSSAASRTTYGLPMRATTVRLRAYAARSFARDAVSLEAVDVFKHEAPCWWCQEQR